MQNRQYRRECRRRSVPARRGETALALSSDVEKRDPTCEQDQVGVWRGFSSYRCYLLGRHLGMMSETDGSK